MEYREIGKFYGLTYDKRYVDFIVYENNTISVPMLGLENIIYVDLKPRIELFDTNLKRYNPCRYKTKDDLIVDYDISDDLFDYLKENNMIRYSTDMAYLYDFKYKDGYDKGKYSVPSPYKWAKKKGPILVKQKRGFYN